MSKETKEKLIKAPSHYTHGGKVECWDHYELAMSDEEFRGAMKNNVYKYIFRQGHKDDVVHDLRKAKAYLQRWIDFERGRRVSVRIDSPDDVEKKADAIEVEKFDVVKAKPHCAAYKLHHSGSYCDHEGKYFTTEFHCNNCGTLFVNKEVTI
jgi:hypothetical protein